MFINVNINIKYNNLKQTKISVKKKHLPKHTLKKLNTDSVPLSSSFMCEYSSVNNNATYT